MHLEKKTHPVAYYEKNTIGSSKLFFLLILKNVYLEALVRFLETPHMIRRSK